ncbi:metallophosphoesterase [Aerococcaceae bacterium WGS1372]
MNIGFISDLHIDNFSYQPYDYITNLTKIIEELELIALVIGGDISNDYQTTAHFVEDLQSDSNIPVYFIPGNHDFWDRKHSIEDINTMKLYESYKAHPQCLIESPLMLTDKVGLVGHTAWYNYVSYNKDKFTLEQIKKGKYKGVIWQDKKYIHWPKSDQAMSEHFAHLIEKDILKLNAEQIILVTHMVTISEFTMRLPHRVFDFFNAYIATNDLDFIYDNYPISHSVMGHIHFRSSLNKDGRQYISNSLGYVKEWRTNDMYTEMKHALQIIRL